MKRLLFLLIFIIGCPKNPIPSEDFLFSATHFDYNTNTNELFIYAEIENITLINAIDSVWAELYNSEGLAMSAVGLVPTVNGIVSQNPYTKTYVISELEYDVYTVTFTMKDESGKLFSTLSSPKDLNPILEPHPSQISSYSICESFDATCNAIIDNTVTLDAHEWEKITFLLHVSDSNGFVDISHIKYEIKGTLIGCEADTNNDGEILGGEIWLDYEDLGTPGHEWEFEFIDYYSVNGNYEASFIYQGVMWLRPRDGSAYYQNGEEIYEAADCGRTGNIELQFIVTDSSSEPTIISAIPLIIIAP